MGWMQKLYDTYENCESLVGVRESEAKPPLMPIYHTTQQAQIEVTLDTDGCLRGARVLEDKRQRTTLIPCTEKSASRTSDPVLPHPLFDNLSYLAGDYTNYRSLEGKKAGRHAAYMEQLSGWCESPFGKLKVRAVRKYLQNGRLMADLIREKVLYADGTGTLPPKWEGAKEDTPPIFKAVTGDQTDAFIRFQVVSASGAEDLSSRIWEDPDVWQSFIDYQNSLPADRDYCYVLGRKIPVSKTSPKYIRRPGDGAKLISANDRDGFTFRGRFDTASQAFCVGRETTEKAHNALKWLIPRQAYINGDQVILAWRTDGGPTVNPCENSLDALLDLEPDAASVPTGENFAKHFRAALAGYGGRLNGSEEACVIGLDSATPGRLSIFYYREMREKDLLARVARWHETCRWRFLAFPKKAEAPGKRPIPFVGAPSPETIVEAAYGRQASDKLKKYIVQRLLPCIVDSAVLPRDIMLCAARRASNPAALDDAELQTVLAVACALIRKYHNDKIHMENADEYKERWTMSLDTGETDRNYLFGRALAYAQQLESYALRQMGESRNTNAQRMQAAFSQHPARVWKTLYHALLPYIQKLGPRGFPYCDGLNAVISQIRERDFTNEPLSEVYLLGYACQMQKFREERDEAIRAKSEAKQNEGEE